MYDFAQIYINSASRFKFALIVNLSVYNNIADYWMTLITNLQLVGHVDPVCNVGPVANVSLSSSIHISMYFAQIYIHSVARFKCALTVKMYIGSTGYITYFIYVFIADCATAAGPSNLQLVATMASAIPTTANCISNWSPAWLDQNLLVSNQLVCHLCGYEHLPGVRKVRFCLIKLSL